MKTNTHKKILAGRPEAIKNVFAADDMERLLNLLEVPSNVYDYQKNEMLCVNSKFTYLTGLTHEECRGLSVDRFSRWVHPDDLALMRTSIGERLRKSYEQYMHSADDKLIYTLNYRLKTKSGKYRSVLAQCSICEWDAQHRPLKSINLLTDLSAYTNTHKIILVIKHFDSFKNDWEDVLREELLHAPYHLAKREMEILPHMLQGKSATRIADELTMNAYTVRSHWRNILQKTHCKTQKELKEKAKQEGWM